MQTGRKNKQYANTAGPELMQTKPHTLEHGKFNHSALTVFFFSSPPFRRLNLPFSILMLFFSPAYLTLGPQVK